MSIPNALLRKKNRQKVTDEEQDSTPSKDAKEQNHDEAVDSNKQPLLSHLVALRSSLLRSILAVALLFLPAYWFANDIYEFIADPIKTYMPETLKMIATDVASPFLTPFKLSVYVGFFAAIPYILHQIWRFASPGLYLREKRFALPLLVSSITLFYSGMAFAYYVVFPLIFQFIAYTTPENVTWMTDINRYLSFVIKLFFAFGLAFEIPIATLLLVISGLTTPQSLSKKRPYVIVGCFGFGMLLTPPDWISQVFLAVPCWILFELGILLSRLLIRNREES